MATRCSIRLSARSVGGRGLVRLESIDRMRLAVRVALRWASPHVMSSSATARLLSGPPLINHEPQLHLSLGEGPSLLP